MMLTRKPFAREARWLVGVGGLLLVMGGPVVLAQERDTAMLDPAAAETPAFVSTLVRTIETSTWPLPATNPAGIVYLPDSNSLLINDSEIDEPPTSSQVNLFEFRLDGSLPLLNTWSTLAFSDEPTGLTLNPHNGHLFIADDTGTPRTIYELEPGSDGQFGTDDDLVSPYNVRHIAADMDPEGIAYAAELRVLFIADGQNSRVFRIAPGENGVFEGVPPVGDDEATSFDTVALGLQEPKGIEYDPATGHLLLVGRSRTLLYEVTTRGELVQTIDISAALPHNPEGLTLAPSSVDPAVMNIYITATGVDNDADPNENDGMIYEMTLPETWKQAVILISGSSSGWAKGLAFDDEDIVAYDGGTGQWHLFFDGSDVFGGPEGAANDVDVNAFTLLDEGHPLPTILMSFSLMTWLPKLGWVYPQDIVKFVPTSLGSTTAGALSLYFDGSRAGFSTRGERIDAIGFTPDGRLVLSTSGDFSVGEVSGRGEDLLVRSRNGNQWQIYFEGADIGLGEANEDIWGVWIDAQGNLYLTTKGQSHVPGLVGDSHDILLCTNRRVTPNSSCDAFTRYWDGDAAGLYVASIDGLAMTSRATLTSLPSYPLSGFARMTKPDGEFPYDAADDVAEADFDVEEQLQRLFVPRLYK